MERLYYFYVMSEDKKGMWWKRRGRIKPERQSIELEKLKRNYLSEVLALIEKTSSLGRARTLHHTGRTKNVHAFTQPPREFTQPLRGKKRIACFYPNHYFSEVMTYDHSHKNDSLVSVPVLVHFSAAQVMIQVITDHWSGKKGSLASVLMHVFALPLYSA